MLGFVESCNNEVVYPLYVLQVKPKPQSVAPDAHIDKEPEREDDAEYHVQALVVERPGVCAWIDDRVFVDIHNQHIVSAVVELLDDVLELVSELGYALVLSGTEEEVEVVGDAPQMLRPAICDAELRHLVEALGQGGIVGVVDDDFLPVELAA